MKELDQFYDQLNEPQKSCFLALRDLILRLDPAITPEWKYKLPFFYYKGKMFCYLWKDKKTNEPYIGITGGQRINHPLLEKGERKKMSVFRVNPNEDIPNETIAEILNEVLELYRLNI